MQCETGREAMVAEAVGKVTTAIAKAEAELKVQQARIEQVRLQLEADVVAPARAGHRQAEARGKAAKMVKKHATILTQMIETWKAAEHHRHLPHAEAPEASCRPSSRRSRTSASTASLAFRLHAGRAGGPARRAGEGGVGVDLAKVVGRLGAPEEKGLLKG